MFLNIIGNVWKFIKKCRNDNISAFAAQSAFFIILSIIPFLMLFISLVQYTPITKAMVMDVVNQMMPDYLSPLMISILHEIYSRRIGITSVSAIVAIWASAKGIQYLANGLNAIDGVVENRNYFVLRLRAVLYTMVLIVVIVLILMLLVFGNSLQLFLQQYVPTAKAVAEVIIGVRALLMFAMFVLFFAVLYKMLPERKVTLCSQLPGSMICAVLWLLFSFGLSVYINYFNGFSMYGSLTAIVLLMLCLYFCMYILLMCAEINKLLYSRNS